MLQTFITMCHRTLSKLTGRSLAAFKRDFSHIFQTRHAKWLQKKDGRSIPSYPTKKTKPTEIYLEA